MLLWTLTQLFGRLLKTHKSSLNQNTMSPSSLITSLPFLVFVASFTSHRSLINILLLVYLITMFPFLCARPSLFFVSSVTAFSEWSLRFPVFWFLPVNSQIRLCLLPARLFAQSATDYPCNDPLRLRLLPARLFALIVIWFPVHRPSVK